jgi:hypothetical protein
LFEAEFAVGLALLDTLGKHGMGMAKGIADGLGDLELGTTSPHLHQGLFLGAAAHHGFFRMSELEITTDGCGLGDAGAVVQFQYGHAAHGILGEEGLAAVLATGEVHLDQRDGDALFGHEDAHQSGIGGGCRVVEDHGMVSAGVDTMMNHLLCYPSWLSLTPWRRAFNYNNG